MQVTAPAEALSTFHAFIRFLPSVSYLMSTEVTCIYLVFALREFFHVTSIPAQLDFQISDFFLVHVVLLRMLRKLLGDSSSPVHHLVD